MALHELEVFSNAIDAAFSADGSLLAVLHLDGIAVYEWNSTDSGLTPPLTGRVTFEKTERADDMYQQMTFINKNSLLVLQPIAASDEPIKKYAFSDDTGRMEKVASGINTNSIIRTMSSFAQDGLSHPFVQTGSGELHSLAFGDHSLKNCNFPAYLPWVEIIPYKEDFLAFGMSNNGNLYANNRLLAKNCTSFLVTPAHLIFSTTTHLVKFVHITDISGKLYIELSG